MPARLIPRERDQLLALFELRWRLFTYSLRTTDSKVAFAFFLTGRLLVLGFAIATGAGSGFAAYYGYTRHNRTLATALMVIFMGWQSLGILRGTTPRGVETELLRFPFRFRTYVLLWLSSGFFEGSTILGSSACMGLLFGLLAAGTQAWLAAGVPMLFLVCNFVLSRALYLHLNRLLAKRRTREFTLILISTLGLLPTVLRTNRHPLDRLVHIPVLHVLHPVWQLLPPAFADHALQNASPWLPLAGLAVWTVALMIDLGHSLRKTYRGEMLQEFAASSATVRLRKKVKEASRADGLTHPALVVARMEWTRLRHSGTALYQVFSPLLFVVIFGARTLTHAHGAWMLPVVAAYMGLQLKSVNAFGADGRGVQCFLLMPVPMRSILMGKNLFAAIVYAVQLASVALLILPAAHRLQVAAVLFTVLWAGCYCSVCFGLGNRRSLSSPMYMPTLGERRTFRATNRARRNGAGGWRVLLTVIGLGLLGLVIVSVALWLKRPALAPAVMLPFTIAGVLLYRRSLSDPVLNGDILAAEPLMEVIARSGS